MNTYNKTEYNKTTQLRSQIESSRTLPRCLLRSISAYRIAEVRLDMKKKIPFDPDDLGSKGPTPVWKMKLIRLCKYGKYNRRYGEILVARHQQKTASSSSSQPKE